MTIEQAKTLLLSQGWVCTRCSCPHQTGYDCASKHHKGIILQLRNNIFKVKQKGNTIHLGYLPSLQNKLNELSND